MTEFWENPAGPIDETTGSRERQQADQRVVDAEDGMRKTREVTGVVRNLFGYSRELHEKNHYVQRLLPILRGTH